MTRLLIAPALLSTFALVAAAGCGRNQGLPPRPENAGTPQASRTIENQDINPRDDPDRFPAIDNRVPD